MATSSVIAHKGVSTPPHFKIIPPFLKISHLPPSYQQIGHPKFSLLKEMQLCEIKFNKFHACKTTTQRWVFHF